MGAASVSTKAHLLGRTAERYERSLRAHLPWPQARRVQNAAGRYGSCERCCRGFSVACLGSSNLAIDHEAYQDEVVGGYVTDDIASHECPADVRSGEHHLDEVSADQDVCCVPMGMSGYHAVAVSDSYSLDFPFLCLPDSCLVPMP